MQLLENGQGESLKLSVHACLGVCCAICAAYNTARWLTGKRERHNAVNAWIYAAGTVGEVYQTSCHWRVRN
jgi:hypothetical protein